ncbi:hypothetical protein [Sphingobium sp. DC-2]|uniref:hypothetical protein n=1 Tax=Sphingobium sp. DC-2 TaxID=1303256 RepID=UPI0004C31AA0|nr:hypothetical protein [Sphingobium sp. DC-2]
MTSRPARLSDPRIAFFEKPVPTFSRDAPYLIAASLFAKNRSHFFARCTLFDHRIAFCEKPVPTFSRDALSRSD